MKTKVLVILLILFQNPLFAKAPDWVRNYGITSRFPEKLFLTGFGIATVSENMDKANCLEAAKKNAARSLSEKILVKIKSEITSVTVEKNQNFSQFFRVATITSSNLQVQGLEYWQYYDKKHNTAYALAHASRDNLGQFYKFKRYELLAKLKNEQRMASEFEKQGQFDKALTTYFSCEKLMLNLNEIQSILSGIKPLMEDFVLDSPLLKELFDRYTEIDLAIRRIINRPINCINDAASLIVFHLQKQFEAHKFDVKVYPFSFQETEICSQFSAYFKKAIEQNIAQTTNWDLTDSVSAYLQNHLNLRTKQSLTKEKKQPILVLKGNYWEQEDNIKIFVRMISLSNNKVVASTDMTFLKKVVTQANLRIKPQNFETAYSDFKIFNANEVVSEGLSIDVITNKGTDNVIFKSGEKMKVWIRVNMPCHIRFIYHQADGKRVLLLDSYRFDISKVNKFYSNRIMEFECVSPFGIEVLQICAQNKPFKTLNTIKINGLKYLHDDLEKIVSVTRGMKPVIPNEVLYAEKRLTITTIKD